MALLCWLSTAWAVGEVVPALLDQRSAGLRCDATSKAVRLLVCRSADCSRHALLVVAGRVVESWSSRCWRCCCIVYSRSRFSRCSAVVVHADLGRCVERMNEGCAEVLSAACCSLSQFERKGLATCRCTASVCSGSFGQSVACVTVSAPLASSHSARSKEVDDPLLSAPRLMNSCMMYVQTNRHAATVQLEVWITFSNHWGSSSRGIRGLSSRVSALGF